MYDSKVEILNMYQNLRAVQSLERKLGVLRPKLRRIKRSSGVDPTAQHRFESIEKIKEDLKVLKVPDDIMRVVPNGVDFYRLQEIKPSNEAFDIFYLGRLISHKNVDVLLRAVSIAREKIQDIRCGIIGDGPEMGKLRTLSGELGLDENVTFFGFIESDEEVYARMRSSKIFVLPSTREGFPNTILEANACGLPAMIVRHEKNAGIGGC